MATDAELQRVVLMLGETAAGVTRLAGALEKTHDALQRVVEEQYRRSERYAQSILELAHEVQVIPIAVADRIEATVRRQTETNLNDIRHVVDDLRAALWHETRGIDIRAGAVTPSNGTSLGAVPLHVIDEPSARILAEQLAKEQEKLNAKPVPLKVDSADSFVALSVYAFKALSPKVKAAIFAGVAVAACEFAKFVWDWFKHR